MTKTTTTTTRYMWLAPFANIEVPFDSTTTTIKQLNTIFIMLDR